MNRDTSCNPRLIHSNLRQFPETCCVSTQPISLLRRPTQATGSARAPRLGAAFVPRGTSAEDLEPSASCPCASHEGRGDFRTPSDSFCSVSLSAETSALPPLPSVLKSSVTWPYLNKDTIKESCTNELRITQNINNG